MAPIVAIALKIAFWGIGMATSGRAVSIGDAMKKFNADLKGFLPPPPSGASEWTAEEAQAFYNEKDASIDEKANRIIDRMQDPPPAPAKGGGV